MACPPDVPRPDPLQLLEQQESQRLPWLLPIRHSRMAQDPFAFFRGAAVVMAADLAREPHSGLMVQLCGDAHLLNFGFYGSPERQLLFDITDFDETHPGPFEWDVIRLATSLVLAARSLGLSEQQQSRITRRAVRAYGEAMATFASMPVLQMWAVRLQLQELLEQLASSRFRSHLRTLMDDARRRTSRQAVDKHCASSSDGALKFRHEPPLIWRFEELPQQWLAGLDGQTWVNSADSLYQQTLSPAMRTLLSHFRISDSALKAVGVGSVGTRCAINLLVGDHPDDVLVLQGKQVEPSVLSPYLNTQAPEHQGERVVQGQRLMQTYSDPFLGWTTNPHGQPIYIRQFRDWKASVAISQLDDDGLKDYGKLCGWTLAKAHARSGDRQAISAFIEDPRRFSRIIEGQALQHADLVTGDHRRLLEAIRTGRIQSSDSP